MITSSILALGASGLLVMAQSTTPQTPQNPQRSTTRSSSSSTSEQTQTTTGTDSQMASKVRQALMNDQSIGTEAHNVHVTAKNGMVTLKGKVNSESERDAIVSKAKEVAGASNVKDDLTISSKK